MLGAWSGWGFMPAEGLPIKVNNGVWKEGKQCVSVLDAQLVPEQWWLLGALFFSRPGRQRPGRQQAYIEAGLITIWGGAWGLSSAVQAPEA